MAATNLKAGLDKLVAATTHPGYASQQSSPVPAQDVDQPKLDNGEKLRQVVEMLEVDEGTAMDLLEAHDWQIDRAVEL
jgi:hypothetical protein